MERVLITGGAGFVGANLATALAARGLAGEVVALDNLHRPGSELNLPRLRDAGVEFVHADVRERDGLLGLPQIDALVECSAEPSALAGHSGDTSYSFETNLVGAYNCLELARRDSAQVVFLSTSRVYPYAALRNLALERGESRFELAPEQPAPGASPAGISEEFGLAGPRTLYGATKLGAELLIAEYAANFGLRAVIDRCGVIAGPWQMGKVDQGVFTFWLLHHLLGRPLTYLGYGGEGLQVRDLLHVDDLVDLVVEQLAEPQRWAGVVANVGGGREISLSLAETTAICRELTGNEVVIGSADDERPGDVPLYLSDCARLHALTSWRPRRRPERVLADTLDWAREHEAELAAALGFDR